MSFDTIVAHTHCPFAKPSRMGPPLSIASTDVETELRAHAGAIATFFRQAKARQYDGLVITFEDETLGHTLAALTALTRRFFATLAQLFPTVTIPAHPSRDDTWTPMIEGERFFLVSFAPCYPPTSPRYAHGASATYFLLQPASTFVRNARAIAVHRGRIHLAFEEAGQPYDAALANVANDMFKAVMPIAPIDQHVAWWEDDEP